MLKHFFTRQFLKFLFVGATAALANWVSRIIFSFWMSFSLAISAAYLVGMTSAFLLNKKFVFPNSSRPIQKQIRDFTLTNLVAFPLVWLMSIQIRNFLQGVGMVAYSEELAHMLALSIPTIVSFLIYKFLAFGEDKLLNN
jgi:putative flippase GtrA